MGFLSNLFKKKDEIQGSGVISERLVIDYSSQGININGRSIQLPANLSEFAFLGEPRKISTKAGVNYAWDNLGVHCYTRDRGMVSCFGVTMNKGEFSNETNARSLFGGDLTISGQDWKVEIQRGQNTEVLTMLDLGDYSVAAEYCVFLDSSKYSVVEIQPQ